MVMYSFYIDDVLLPITPSKLQIKITNKNKTLTLINDGEINFLKKPGLTEINFDMIIPQVKYPFATYKNGFKPASYYIYKLEQLKTKSSKFRFIVSRISPAGEYLFDTNMKVSLEDYTITEDASQGLDLVVSVKLKQYKDYGTKITAVKTTSSTDNNESGESNETVVALSIITDSTESTKEIPKTYTVLEGDTLWGICKKELGDGSKYATVAELNSISNPNSISIGQVIRLG